MDREEFIQNQAVLVAHAMLAAAREAFSYRTGTTGDESFADAQRIQKGAEMMILSWLYVVAADGALPTLTPKFMEKTDDHQ